jgi:hypothetical protein
MRFRHWLLFLIPGVLFPATTLAQDRCGFNYLQEKTERLNPSHRQQFENWLSAKVRQRGNLRTKSTFSIPIVVHVIHNGEPVGSGLNISDAQIMSQIDVLNKDYKRLNDDRVNTPPEFAGVASSIDIDFVLAKQDPEGLPTTGIVRVQGAKTAWTIDNSPEFKAQSYWPAEDYLNIWVVQLLGDLLGFAQFPITTLPGVEGPFDRLTDGVISDYRVFGTTDAGAFPLDPQYNKGRTTTHEVGHYLGLLHIFGSQEPCSTTTDYVNDTPSQSIPTLTCAVHPSQDCGHNKMFQNYMDYTDDACMNLFTAGQITRVLTVLQDSPRRNSLSMSHGLQDPVILSLDLEARRVVSPFEMTCGQDIVPRVELRNRGTTVVTSAQIRFLVNGTAMETKTATLNMNHLDLATVSFAPVNLPEGATAGVTFEILQVNGGPDGNAVNNSTALSSQVIPRTSIPFTEAFNVTPSSWQVQNTDHGTTWSNVVAPKATANNRAMFMELYNYENTGSKDRLVSNAIDLPADEAAVLRFDRAYAPSPSNSSDYLRVFVSTGCSADPATAVEIFVKNGPALATAPQTNAYFRPSGELQWLTETISLAAFTGKNVQLIFETTNGYGNNFYLDNVSVSGGDFDDVSVSSIVSPSGPVFCEPEPDPVIEVQNLGSKIVNRLNVTTEINGATRSVRMFTGLNLNIGASANFTLDPVTLTADDEYAVRFIISNPDVSSDQTPGNNSLSTKWVLSREAHASPLRMDIDNAVPMSLVSPAASQVWELTSTNYGTSLVYQAYDNPTVAEKSWAVTPTMDLSHTSQGALFFDTSYGLRSGGDERLRLMVSEDCGMHYNEIIFDMAGAALSNEDSNNAPWEPGDESDWTKQYVSLNDFAGKDQVRFAFVVDNGHGNNLYIDNLEWFVEDDPSPPQTTELFSVYSSEFDPYDFFVTFNLQEKEAARLVVYNMMGQVLIDSILPGTLNQTYTVNLYGQSTGIYLFRLQAGDTVETTKLFVGK